MLLAVGDAFVVDLRSGELRGRRELLENQNEIDQVKRYSLSSP